MIVRPARRADLLGMGRVADAAHWASYAELLGPDTLRRFVADEFGPSRLARRLLRGGVTVIEAHDDLVAFADGLVADGAVHVDVIAVAPGARRRGAGTALLRAVSDLAPGLAITADVFLGNLEGEGFYEANGFVPGEIVERRLYDEEVVERRWWREAVVAERTRPVRVHG